MLVLWSMRLLAATAVAVALAGLSGGADASRESVYRGKCGQQPLPNGPGGLPVPVEIWTDCGVFVVETDGAVSSRPGRGNWFPRAESRRPALDLPPPRLRPRRVGIYSGFLANPAIGSVAFTATEGYTGYMEVGYETVYLLEKGRKPRTLVRKRLRFTLCGRGVQLSWRGSWLLYGAGEGHAVAIHTASRRVIDLTATLSRLPGTKRDSHGYRVMSVTWASRPSRRGTGFARSARTAQRQGTLQVIRRPRRAERPARLQRVAESRETFSEERS